MKIRRFYRRYIYWNLFDLKIYLRGRLKRGYNKSIIGKMMRYKELTFEMVKEEWNNREICSDPMNGCPGDFAEASNHRSEQMYWKKERLGLDIPKWFKTYVSMGIMDYEKKRERLYNQLPWNDSYNEAYKEGDDDLPF